MTTPTNEHQMTTLQEMAEHLHGNISVCGCDGDCEQCTLHRSLILTALESARQEGREVVAKALDALESDATREDRAAAFDALRDHFFPTLQQGVQAEGDTLTQKQEQL